LTMWNVEKIWGYFNSRKLDSNRGAPKKNGSAAPTWFDFKEKIHQDVEENKID